MEGRKREGGLRVMVSWSMWMDKMEGKSKGRLERERKTKRKVKEKEAQAHITQIQQTGRDKRYKGA